MAPINSVNTHLSGGAIAGIVIGVVVFIIVLVIAIIYLARYLAAKAHKESLHNQKERDLKGHTRKRDGTLHNPNPPPVPPQVVQT
jgi:membrane protein implicated in regulation of membrane protease activity